MRGGFFYLDGTILKATGGFFLVRSDRNDQNYRCRARGKLKREKNNLLVGDRVQFTPSGFGAGNAGVKEGVIEAVKPRSNRLLRPPVANVDQVIVVFALKEPEPDWQLVSRLLVLAEEAGLEAVLCLNKVDLVDAEKMAEVSRLLEPFPYRFHFVSAKTGHGIETARAMLAGCCSVFAGPSGTGKSSILNMVEPGLTLNTAPVSEKTGRGRHTTRAVELLPLRGGGMVVDTPGFTRLDLSHLEPAALNEFFPELRETSGKCSFRNCLHLDEPGCAIKQAVAEGKINPLRYRHYSTLIGELNEREKW